MLIEFCMCDFHMQVKQMADRKRNEETAAFNVGVSEAINVSVLSLCKTFGAVFQCCIVLKNFVLFNSFL